MRCDLAALPCFTTLPPSIHPCRLRYATCRLCRPARGRCRFRRVLLVVLSTVKQNLCFLYFIPYSTACQHYPLTSTFRFVCTTSPLVPLSILADAGMPRAASAVPPVGAADPRYGAGYGTPGPGYSGGYGGGYSGGYGGYGTPPYGQPPQPGYYQGGGGYGGYPPPHPSLQQQRYFGGRGGGRGRWQGQGQGPTIDVYYDNAESGSGAWAGPRSGQGSGSRPAAS